MKLADSLASITKKLMLIEPFYGLFLIGLDKQWTDDVKTACVGLHNINYTLKISPKFWESLDDNKRKGLVKHELLHIGFFHLTDFKHLENQMIANWAMDIEINQYIDPEWLPEGGLLPDTFPELNLEYKQGTRYYYDKLMEASKKRKDKCQNLVAMQGAADAGENEVELPDGTKVTLPDHDWEEIEKMDETTEQLVKAQLGHMLESLEEQVQKIAGSVPGEFEGILKRLKELDPPKFDWKGYMRRFIGKSTEIYTKKSRRKMNKRHPDLPGLKIKKRKHVLVAIDTSASVSVKELNEFLNEMYHIQKTGCEVTLCECDTAIAYLGKFDPKKDIPLHGRGGTSFQPVIDYYNENQGIYSCLFYFTDGEAWTPDNATGNILWVLSEQSDMNDDLPGHVIQLN